MRKLQNQGILDGSEPWHKSYIEASKKHRYEALRRQADMWGCSVEEAAERLERYNAEAYLRASQACQASGPGEVQAQADALKPLLDCLSSRAVFDYEYQKRADSDIVEETAWEGPGRARVETWWEGTDKPFSEYQTADGSQGFKFGEGKYRRRYVSIENPVLYIKKFPRNLYKVVQMLDPAMGPGDTEKEPSFDDDLGRFACNIARAKTAVEEYGLCNDFDFFATFTISPQSQDRSDLKKFRTRLTQMVRDYRRRRDIDIQYLLVPELHRDGENWHIHGLLQCPSEFLERYGPEMQGFEKMPLRIKESVATGHEIYRWTAAQKTFGWNTLERIKDLERSTRYMLKYFSKDERRTAEKLKKGDSLYYVSHGLKRAEKVNPEALAALPGLRKEYQRNGEYCIVTWIRIGSGSSDDGSIIPVDLEFVNPLV